MPLAPITQQSSLAEHCYHRMKDAILQLDLRPGEPLVESRLAAQLGTSKSPVREALLRLTSEGLVVNSLGRSSVVAGIALHDIHDWYELRSILEPASLAVAGQLLSPDDLDRLKSCNATTADGLRHQDIAAYVHGSESFHLQLIRLNPNLALVQFVEQILERIRRVRVALYELDRREQQDAGGHGGIKRHNMILQHLENGEVGAAQDILRADITLFLDRLDLPEVQAALRTTQLPPAMALNHSGNSLPLGSS